MRNRSVLFLLGLTLAILVPRPGRSADTTPPTVIDQIPAAGASLVKLTSIEVFFSEPVDGVDVSDLLINGTPATNLNQVTASQYLFTFPQPPIGTLTITWAAGHGIMDQALPPNPFAGGGWTYVLDPDLALNDVRINEFLADNQTGLRDEDGTYQDWIELFNNSSIDVSLEGCFLTDTKLKLDQWRFPRVLLPSKGYLLVWASNKDRTNNNAALHTNFKLDSAGGYLAFAGRQTNVISSFDPQYPPQRADVSYGRDPSDPSITGYYSRPTPRAANLGTGDTGSDFAANVLFSQPSGTFVVPFNLVLGTTSSNAVIRYITFSSLPSGTLNLATNVPNLTNSQIYTGPIPISASTQVRARAFETGKLPSPVISETFLQLSPEMTSFSSDIPMVLITLFGQPLPSSGDGTAYMMVFDNTLDRSSMTNVPDVATRAAANDRGSSTANQPKNNMAIEIWDEFNQDFKGYGIAGLPPESDFVFYGIDGFDPSLMHNAIFYWFGRALGRYSSSTRYVEVFRKNDLGPVTTNDYFGLYLVEEKPKRSKDRIDVVNLQPENTNAVDITGGYVLKIDRQDADEVAFSTATVNGIGGYSPIFISPNLTPANISGPTADGRRILQMNWIQSYINQMVTNMTSANWTNPITGYRAYLDADSWVDNTIMNIICFNVDGYRLSGYFFKDRGKKMEQGPPWDCDRCLGTGGSANTPQGDNRPWNPRVWRPYTTDPGSDQGTDFFGRSSVGVNWFKRVFTDPDFWQQWIDRYQELRQGVYSDTNVVAMVEGIYQEIKEAQVRELARWGPAPIGKGNFTWPRPGPQSVTTSAGAFSSTYALDFGPTNPLSGGVKVGFFTNEVRAQKQWLVDRLEFLDTNFLAKPTLSLAPGAVTNNTVVTVQAAAKPGSVLYYTLDGTDPRLSGGALSPLALSNVGPLTLNVTDNIRLYARSQNPTHANVTNQTLVGTPLINSTWSGPAIGTYYTALPPLRITELMYNPPPPPPGNTNDSDNFEYIEVKNIGATPLNVNRFRLRGGVDFDFPNATLASGQAGVLVRDVAAFQSRYGSGPLIIGSYTNNLGNGGDHLILEGAAHEPILDFSYNDKWYPMTDGNGFSLQIVNENAATSTWGLKESWRPSGVINGTPGAADPGTPATPTIYVNEALTKTDPLPGDAIELYNPTAGAVNVGGWYLSDSFGTPKKYRIQDNTMIPANGYVVFYQSNSFGIGSVPFGLSSHGDSVYLFAGEPGGNLTGYFHGFNFGAQAAGATFGRYVNSVGAEYFPTQTAPSLGATNNGPKVGPVVISEINYHPVDSYFPKAIVDNFADEYLELQNITGSPAPLYDPANPANTWKLRNGVDFTFPRGVVIPANEFILVVGFTPTNGPALDAFRAANGVPSNVPVYGPWSGHLENNGESLELAQPDVPDPAGTSSAGFVPYLLVDKVDYSNAAPWPVGGPDGFGTSIQRVDSTAFGNDPGNWRAALKTPGGGLPGGTVAPAITSQPADTVGIESFSASFTVTATGSTPLGYQWLFNGQPVRGGIGATLTLNGLALKQAGAYSCLVFNAAGATNTTSAFLTVRPLPHITQHPGDLKMRGSTNNVDYGFATNNAVFTVAATGTGPLHYQWRYNGVPVPGATATTYTVFGAGLTNDGVYDVMVTDDISPVLSLPARLTVLLTPTFVQPPLNQSVVSNGYFSVSTLIRGNPPPFRYEWREISNPKQTENTSSNVAYLTYGPVTNLASRQWRLLISCTGDTRTNFGFFNVVALADVNTNGIPDNWETNYFGPSTVVDRDADPDGDGMSNYLEYLAGTDPTNAMSNLRVDLNALPDHAAVQVGAVSNRTYSVQYRDDLSGGVWKRLGDLSARPTNFSETLIDPGYTSNRFYRVVSPKQP